MNQVVTYNNLLNPEDTQVLYTVARHSSEILEGVKVPDGFEIILSLNSEIMDEPFEINEGDVVNVMVVPMGGGGGKNILATIAMIAVAIVAPQFVGATGMFAEGAALAGYGLGITGVTGTLLSAGIVVAGSLLINAVLPTQTPSINIDNLSTSSTYSWDESYNKMQQAQPVPKVFGTHKITPPLISKYIETVDNKQYFNGLYAVNDGEVTSISNIKINDESIDNFEKVEVYLRNGTLDQLMIPNFDNVRSDKGINRKLTTTFVETATNGNQVIGLTATLVFPRGIYYAQNDGNIGSNSVKIVLEYSTDEIIWNDLATDDTIPQYYYGYDYDNGYFRADALKGNFIEWVNSLPAGAIRYKDGSRFYKYNEWYYTTSYTVPYATITDSSTSTLRKTFKVSNLPPSKYYIRAKFYEEPTTGSRYGSDCYLEYITEEVGDDFIYPSTALISIRALATDQLSGSAPKITCVVTANSDNPSIISKTILQDVGVDISRFMSGFDTWSAYCISKNLKFNGVFDSTVSVRKALDLVGIIGRGSVIQFGSKFDVIIDKPDEIPVQAFTLGMGNIIKDSFKQTFLPIVDRANVIELTYYDASNDYENTVIEVSSGNFDSVAELNKTSVTLIGCTNRTQAWKHAKYLLNCNRYLTETITLQADKDSLVCKYGDIVKVSHDVPMYGISGRIESCTTQRVVLDREVSMIFGKNYAVQIRDKNNNTYELPVVNTQSTTNELTFINTLSTPFLEFNNYSFGEIGKTSKLFRVLKISTGDDLTRTLTLLEYNEDVYNDEVTIDIPTISSFGISNLRATDYIRYAKDGSIETVMQLAWSGASLYYVVSYKKNTDSVYQSIKVFDNYINLTVDDTLYNVIVSDANGASISFDYQVIGKLAKPNAITDFTSNELNDVFSISWTYNDAPIDFKEFRIYQKNILLGSTNSLSYSVPIIEKTSIVSVRAVDTSGVESEYINNALTVAYLNDVTNVNTIYQNNELIAFWDEVTSNRVLSYEIRRGSSWVTAQIISNEIQPKTTIYSNGTYLIKAFYITNGGYKIESENAYSLVIDEATLSKNVLEFFEESVTWSGTKVNTMVTDNGLTLTGQSVDDYVDVDLISNFDYGNEIVAQGTYESLNIVDLETPKLCKIYSNIELEAFSINNNFDLIPNVDLVLSVDGYVSSDFAVEIQIAISQDGLTYGAWKKFINGDYMGQSFKMRLVLSSFNTLVTPIVSYFDFTIDMPDILESGSDTSDVTTKSITYVNNFSISPKVQITILNAVQGDDAILTNETADGFDIEIKNGGSNVTRSFNYFVKGY